MIYVLEWDWDRIGMESEWVFLPMDSRNLSSGEYPMLWTVLL